MPDGRSNTSEFKPALSLRPILRSRFSSSIPDHVYYEGVKFLRSGYESDRLIMVLAKRYDLPKKQRRMVNHFSFTAIALHRDDVDMEVEPISIKLFGNARCEVAAD